MYLFLACKDVLLKYTQAPTPTSPPFCVKVLMVRDQDFGDVEPSSGKNQGNKKGESFYVVRGASGIVSLECLVKAKHRERRKRQVLELVLDSYVAFP